MERTAITDDPVSRLTSDQPDMMDFIDPDVYDAPPISETRNEVPQEQGKEEQEDKKQGPLPSSNRTQVERDALYRAVADDTVWQQDDRSQLIDAARDLAAVLRNLTKSAGESPESQRRPPIERSILRRQIAEAFQNDLMVELGQRDSVGVGDASNWFRCPSCGSMRRPKEFDEGCGRCLDCGSEWPVAAFECKGKAMAKQSVVRDTFMTLHKHVGDLFEKIATNTDVIDAPAGWDTKPAMLGNRRVGIGLPSDTSGPNDYLLRGLHNLTNPHRKWADCGWWYERVFKIPHEKRGAFKVALMGELIEGVMSHAFKTADHDDGVKVVVDRTNGGLNTAFTSKAERVYRDFCKHNKVAMPEDEIPGGKADGKPDLRYDVRELHEGIETELEHTSDPDIAKEIAKDHLEEQADYYDELEKMEKAATDVENLKHQLDRAGDPGKNKITDTDLGEEDDGEDPFDWGLKLRRVMERRSDPLDKTAADERKTKVTLQISGPRECVGGIVNMLNVVSNLGFIGASRTVRMDVDGDGAFYIETDVKDRGDLPDDDVLNRIFTVENDDDVILATLDDSGQMEKEAAAKPYRRRVEVVITDGLQVWGSKQPYSQGGLWFPGGGVDTRDEKFGDAAVREVMEETGFKVRQIKRLAEITPVSCRWHEGAFDNDDPKWQEKTKQWVGDRTHIYVATVERQGDATSRENDVMDGEWMDFSTAASRLERSLPFDNKGWRPLTRARLRAVRMIQPPFLRTPNQGAIDVDADGTSEGGSDKAA